MKAALLACLLAAAPLGARESLRLPWAFSDEPDLVADFGFEPAAGGRVRVDLVLGGRFAGFGLPRGAGRAPRLDISAEFTAPSDLDRDVRALSTRVDLADVLKEYGLDFSRGRFGEASRLVYKASLETDLAPGDYNVSVRVADPALGVDSRRTLHLIVPEIPDGRWQLGDLKFITAVGQRLDEKGRAQRVLDPNPWRQVGGGLGWDLLVAYSDRGPRPAGPLKRRVSIRRLRGDGGTVWSREDDAPAKKADQVWLLNLKEPDFHAWKAGVYVLEVELDAGGRKARASKTFEILP